MGSSSTLPAFRISTPSPSCGRTGLSVFFVVRFAILYPLYLTDLSGFRSVTGRAFGYFQSKCPTGWTLLSKTVGRGMESPFHLRGNVRKPPPQARSGHIQIVQILCAVLCDVLLASSEVVAQQQVEHARRSRSTSVGSTLMRRRLSGFMVVSHIISGSFSPRPLERWMVYFFSPISFEERRPSPARCRRNRCGLWW